MQTKTIELKYGPNALRVIIILHIKSPAIHDWVKRHPISNGIMTNVTIRSAIVRLNISKLIRSLIRFRFLNSALNTVKFPHADRMNKIA